MENTRNVPFMSIAAAEDELVPYPGPLQQHVGPAVNGLTSFDQLGYRFRFLTLPVGEHYTIGLLGYDVPPAREFLAADLVDRDPFHVTYAYLPATDDPALGLVHDKAYWVSDITWADPVSVAGTAAGTAPLPYVEVNRAWGMPVSVPSAEPAGGVAAQRRACHHRRPPQPPPPRSADRACGDVDPRRRRGARRPWPPAPHRRRVGGESHPHGGAERQRVVMSLRRVRATRPRRTPATPT